ncbi:MAG: hypothetical protein SFV23_07170 [Planctomycetaceae bacterium]|nr:hypothetical protein [Planctomycetaceae bacterium]
MDPGYLCDMNCVFEFRGRIDFERLKNAYLTALANEPMWSHRFVQTFWRPYWSPIPRSQRPELVQVVTTDGSSAALGPILQQPLDAAVRIWLLRGPTDDTLCFRVDHRLADMAAARLLIEAIAGHYAAGDSEPPVDAPLVRRTIKLLRSVVSLAQRRQNFRKAGEELRAMKQALVPLRIPPATPEDPAIPPQILQFAAGALDALRAKAMQDRGTPSLVISAATYLALREVVGITPNAPVYLGMAVDLRRYLPAEHHPAHACMLLGRVFVPVEEPGATTIPAVMEQLRVALAARRGSQFGLIHSTIALDLPLVRFVSDWLPFAWLRRANQRRKQRGDLALDVAVSDLGELGRPGDRWGDAVLQNGYGIPGYFSALFVPSSTCGSRINIALSTGGSRSFAVKLAEVLQRLLCEYIDWPAPAGPG